MTECRIHFIDIFTAIASKTYTYKCITSHHFSKVQNGYLEILYVFTLFNLPVIATYPKTACLGYLGLST